MPGPPLVTAHVVFGAPQLAGERPHHEKSKFGRGFGEHLGGMSEGDFVVVGVSAIDVVEADGKLRDDFEVSFTGLENFSVDGIAQGGDESVYAAAQLFDNGFLRWRLGAGIDLNLVTALAQQIESFADIAGGIDALLVGHAVGSKKV